MRALLLFTVLLVVGACVTIMWDFHCGAPLRRLLAPVRVGCAGLFLGFSQTIRFRGLPGSPGSVTAKRRLAACAGGGLRPEGVGKLKDVAAVVSGTIRSGNNSARRCSTSNGWLVRSPELVMVSGGCL